MNEWRTLKQVEHELGVSRPTLLKHIRRAGIQVRFDPHDYRVKLLDADQINQLREIIERIRKRSG